MPTPYIGWTDDMEMNVRQNNTKKPNPKIVEAKEKKEAKALLKAPAKGLSEHTKEDSLLRGVVNQEKTPPAQEDNRDLNLSDVREGSGGDEATARFVSKWSYIPYRGLYRGTVTAVSGSCRTTKLMFKGIQDLILVEIIHRNIREYTNYLLSAEVRYRGRGYKRGLEEEQKQVKIMEDRRDKVVNMAAGDSDDALVCCVENTVEGHIMDSGASFHATYCKEELERFKLHSGKVRLADDKTLNIAGVGDVVLKTSFGTSWTLKDVRYIPGLKRRLILVGQLDKEGYHVCFGDQQWKVTKGSLVVAHGNKRRSLYMVKIGMSMLASKGNVPDVWKIDIYFCKPSGLGKQKKLSFIIAESMRLRVEAPKMLWADSVSTTYLIYRVPYVLIGLRISEEEWRGKDTSLTHLKAAAQIKCDTAFGIRRVTRLSEAEILHLWTRFMEPENDNIVAEHRLSSKITQSHPCGSSDTSEGSENSKSFKDSGRLDEEDSKDEAFYEEGGSETPQSLSHIISRKESIKKLMDVQGQRREA
ncbi:retrovirus-related pol polyprotein from transposon TNT 1-94 [Tanacetum coccineum]